MSNSETSPRAERYRRAGLTGLSVLASALLSVCACAGNSSRLTAAGRVAGYSYRGSVDHTLAREYLEGRALPPDLAAVRRRYVTGVEPISREALGQIARKYSPDVATLVFVEALSAQPAVRVLRERYEGELSRVRRVGAALAKPEPPKDLLVLMVPGWFYVAHGSETNADFRVQRRLYEQWGVPHRLVPIHENGTIESNARIVADAIREHAHSHRLIVVSASKSGAEVATALGRELAPRETGHVVAWLSIVGAVRGSPLADRATAPDLCWLVRSKLAFEGFDLAGLQSMKATRSRRRFDTLRFPPHLRIFTLVAVPLSGDISERGTFGYARMREAGPNDGLTLLADELIPGAVPLLLPGVDHFLGRDDQRVWSTAVFRALLTQLPADNAAETL